MQYSVHDDNQRSEAKAICQTDSIVESVMRFSSLTERIGGESAKAWEVHSKALRRERAGEDIIVLSIGQENHEYTPEPIQQAAIDSIRKGRHHYAPISGEATLRQLIAERHNARSGLSVSKDNVCVFAGAQNALFATALCLLEAGDDVIVPEPYYVTYPATFTAGGARLLSVTTSPDDRFQPDVDAIRRLVSPATKALVLNSPNNPTGAVYDRERLQALVDLCVDNDIWIISDEVYADLADPDRYTSIASLPGANAITVTINSLSKSHRMTGWRCGWVIASDEMVEHCENLCLCMSYGLPPFTQDAAIRALAEDIDVATTLRQTLSERFTVMQSQLTGQNGIHLHGNPGGMFAVLDIRALGVSGAEFAHALLDQFAVSVLPADAFGASGQGLLRVSLCEDSDRLIIACDSIKRLVSGYAD